MSRLVFLLAVGMAMASASAYERVIEPDTPEGCPFPKSTTFTGVGFTERHAEYTGADTWYPSWAADGNLYSPWTDGFVCTNGSAGKIECLSFGRNAATGHAVIVGDDPLKLRIVEAGTFKSSPSPYAGRYPCGSLVVDGVWYYGTYCLHPSSYHKKDGVAYNWPWLGPFVGFRWSTDFGKTWHETPCTPEKPLFGESALNGESVQLGVPHFVDFGREMKHSPDGKAYLVVQGSSDGRNRRFGYNSWITADQVFLIRVKPSIENMNNASAYEFFAGHDAKGRPQWTKNRKQMKPILEWRDHMGRVSMTYNPALRKYFMCVTDGRTTCEKFTTYLMEADEMTGPWKMLAYMPDFGPQGYFVNIPSKFISSDGTKMWLAYSANFHGSYKKLKDTFPSHSRYAMCLREFEVLTENIEDGVHLYTPKNYVAPKEPAVVEHLEWFKDQKFGLFMHFGIYSELGIIESWPLSDRDSRWSRKAIEWAKGDEFKQCYIDLYRSFNPVRIDAKDWAKVAKEAGCKYLIFTSKHHDGFCLWDTKYSDYKTTNPKCPFSTNPKADIVRHVFDAFRAEGLGISCYFSKPDWHHPDYWDNCGVGVKTSRNPTYDWRKDKVRWGRFREFVRNQLLELLTGYGKIDVIWLDGGQVRPQNGQDIRLGEILAEARKTQPWLISADRTVGGANENFVTPEQTIPKKPLAVPWESCITLGNSWGYLYDDTYKPPRKVIQMLVDVVAKGGNLAIDIGPLPDGRLPRPAIKCLKEVGAWLDANGEAIYATRVAAPFRTKDWAYTASKDGKFTYAIYLWREGEEQSRELVMDCAKSKEVTKVIHLASGREIKTRVDEHLRLVLSIPKELKFDAIAEAFRLERENGK